MLNNLCERLASISLWVFHLLADVAWTLSDPRHLSGRDVPPRSAWNTGVSKVAILMATCAVHPNYAVAFWTTSYRRLVGYHLHALGGDIPVRMAIGTSRMEQYSAGFKEQHPRTLFLIGKAREIRYRAQLIARHRSQSGKAGVF
jgi:hypothetical protein